MDALLSLLLITVIIGVSADAMDIAGNKINYFCSENSNERIAGDLAEVLIKTPGSPENWEEIKYFNRVTPGLRDIKSKYADNKLSMAKINYLKSNSNLIDKMIPEGMNCSLMIYPIDPSLPAITVINRTSKDEADVYIVNRTVSYEYSLYDIYSTIIMDMGDNFNETEYICPHPSMNFNTHKRPDFKKSKPGWICKPFKISAEDVNSTDFYLITSPPILNDKNSSWLIDKPDNATGSTQKFSKSPVNINSRIKEIWDGNGLLVLHVYISGESFNRFNVYLVGVPSGTPENNIKVDYIGLKSAYFILKIWN
jgi:hypothetical protein